MEMKLYLVMRGHGNGTIDVTYVYPLQLSIVQSQLSQLSKFDASTRRVENKRVSPGAKRSAVHPDISFSL